MAAESLLLYGPSGYYKTAQIGFAALWLFRRTGKRTRLISADGGGWKPLQPLVDAGIIDAWQISTLATPLPVIRKLSLGWWRKVVEDKASPDGRKLILAPTPPEAMAKIGAYACEGITSFGDLIIRDLVQQGRKISEDVVGLWQEQVPGELSGGSMATPEKFGAPGRSHYGFVQNEIPLLLGQFRSLPVEWVWWTAHEARGEDDSLGTHSTVLGPSIAGKKAIGKLPAWVGGLIHADSVNVSTPATAGRAAGNETRVRYYFQSHGEPELPGKAWPAKSRLASQMIPALLAKFPGGYFEPTPEAGLDLYLQVESELQEGMTEKLKAEVAEVEERLAKATSGGANSVGVSNDEGGGK